MPADTALSGSKSPRHYGMDWLRIGAFALLILYHVGLAFSNWPYEFKATRTFEWVAFPLLALNAWRLSLLFAISGYASAAVLSRSSSMPAFLRGRLARLGIPLLFGIVLVAAPQAWVWLRMAMGYRHDFAWFIAHDYFTFRNIDGMVVPTWMHLWFVAYLLVYTLVLGSLALLPSSWRDGSRRLGERVLAGPLLLPVGIAWIYAARRIPGGWSDTHDLIGDLAAHAAYLPVFLFGVLLRASEPLRQAIARQWKLAAILALCGYGVVAGVEWRYPGQAAMSGFLHEPFRIGRATQGWCAMIALFGLADCHWNREGRWRATLAEAVFPFYIIHQTLILVSGYWLRPLGPTPAVEFVVLVAATAGGSWLFYWLGRRIRPLRPLIGLKRHARRPHAPIEPPIGADPSASPS
jgi:surface polysaccharide O-acyltransferase-like enzyme